MNAQRWHMPHTHCRVLLCACALWHPVSSSADTSEPQMSARLHAVGHLAPVEQAGRPVPRVHRARVDVQREQVLPQPEPRAVAALHRLLALCHHLLGLFDDLDRSLNGGEQQCWWLEAGRMHYSRCDQ